jgi:hypothetical protein
MAILLVIVGGKIKMTMMMIVTMVRRVHTLPLMVLTQIGTLTQVP